MFNRINVSILVVCLFILDRLFKYLTLLLPEGEFFNWLNIFSWQKEFNLGIAFGIPLPNILNIIISFLIIVVLIDFLLIKFRTITLGTIFALQLIILGALSNFIDRLTTSGVIDYWSLFILPIFNLADLMILLGVAILITQQYRTKSNK